MHAYTHGGGAQWQPWRVSTYIFDWKLTSFSCSHGFQTRYVSWNLESDALSVEPPSHPNDIRDRILCCVGCCTSYWVLGVYWVPLNSSWKSRLPSCFSVWILLILFYFILTVTLWCSLLWTDSDLHCLSHCYMYISTHVMTVFEWCIFQE